MAPWVWIGIAYLCGSVPFALLLGLARGVDIREHGSGNPGATNLGRTCGKAMGLLCFVLDMGKGLAPTLAFGLSRGLISTEPSAVEAGWWIAVAVAAVIGHVFPVWLKFRGGKGVATSAGVLLGVWPVLTLAGLGGFVVWLTVTKVTGMVALGSIAAAVSLPLWALGIGIAWGLPWETIGVFVAATLVMAVLVVVRHRSNIARLREGTEDAADWTGRNATPADADHAPLP